MALEKRHLSQALPLSALTLISQYSKPLTRPDWRTINPLPFYSLYTEVIQRRTYKRKVLTALYKTIHNGNRISDILYNTHYYNTYIGSIVLNIPELILTNIALYFQPFIDDDPDFIFKYRY
jgi:hypothetical protein